jgi:hypothetical protein
VLRQYFEEELRHHRERLRYGKDVATCPLILLPRAFSEAERSAKQTAAEARRLQDDRLSSLQNYYADQLQIMEDMLQTRLAQSKLEKKEVDNIRRAAKHRLQAKMKEDIRQMLDDLFQEETAAHFRRVEAGQRGAGAR